MKKTVLVLVLAILACGFVFAGNLNTIAIGANYSYMNSFEDDELFLHGPGIAMSSMVNFGSSNAMFYVDLGVEFPLSVDTFGGKMDRSDFDMLIAMDATIGAGYISNPGKSSYFLGAGLQFNEIGMKIDNYASTLDLLLGVAAFGGYQFYFTDNVFLEASAKIGLTMYNWSKLETVFRDFGWQNESYFGMTGVARVLVGYNF